MNIANKTNRPNIFVNVIGLGYIGLPTALMMASHGIRIVGTDLNKELIKELNDGHITFEENGLENLFVEAVDKGISFTNEYKKADIYIVSVPTPYIEETKEVNPSYVIAAVKNIFDICDKGAIIVIESTISPGTIDKYIRPIAKEYNFVDGEDIHFAHAPERIIPGNMVCELINNSRTIGVDDKDIGEIVKSVYSSFCNGEIIVTDIRTAEMTKVVENTYRDINIAFANELLKICRSDGLDVNEIIRIANKHPRVNILNPGPGVGGHCISVDPWFLVGDYPKLTNLIKQAREINNNMPKYVFERLIDIMKKNGISDFSKVGIYGLTYKEDVDDTRESPTLQLLNVIKQERKDTVIVYDPMVKLNDISSCSDFNKFLDEIEIMIIMVHHSHLNENYLAIKNKIIFDTRNCNLEFDNNNKLYLL